MSIKNESVHKAVLPALALRGLVVFPGQVIQFEVGRKKSALAIDEAISTSQTVFLIAQKDIREDDPARVNFMKTGVVATIRQVNKAPGDVIRVVAEGLYRAKITEMIKNDPYLKVEIARCALVETKGNVKTEGLVRSAKNAFDAYCERTQGVPHDIVLEIAATKKPGHLADFIAANVVQDYEAKQMILDELNSVKRLEKLHVLLEREIQMLDIEEEIQQKVQEQINQNQKEYFLREQIKTIMNELGEGDNPYEDAEEFRERMENLNLPIDVQEKLEKDCERFSRMPPGSHDAAVLRNYLDITLGLPWNKTTKDKINIPAARRQLDHDHFGMQKVKERILEMLAVRKLSPDIKGQIICLVGPPGVGKTSIARSIAKAIGRKYVRIALGGVKDESEIRGHRRTYIGAMPGRIISAIRQAKVKNPLMLLDEVDKLSNDFRGDPTSALLEVLDAEQNHTYQDHFIDVPFDLSEVLFLMTANNYGAIPSPLLDRMEIIELPSYTHEEKFAIAKKHLIPKQVKKHGMDAKTIRFRDDAVRFLIDGYTREAGVRNLERKLASLCRKTAVRVVSETEEKCSITIPQIEEMLGPVKYKPEDLSRKSEVGIANGLAWTSVGGEIMPIEVAILDGSGKIELTGSLGDVMKESAKAAVSYIRAHTEELNINHDFYLKKDIHIHVPEGAVPKDGPSAGITLATALISALSGRAVRGDLAMTGEITLRGKVLPIGGLKEKTMAAYRNGMQTVVVPKGNQSDLSELDETVRNRLCFVIADTLDDVLSVALEDSGEEKTAPVEKKVLRAPKGEPVKPAIADTVN